MPMLGPAGAIGLASDLAWYDSIGVLETYSSDYTYLGLEALNISASQVILLRTRGRATRGAVL